MSSSSPIAPSPLASRLRLFVAGLSPLVSGLRLFVCTLRPRAAGLFVGHVLPALLAALSLVSPCDCAGCGVGDVELCGECRARLRPRPLVSALSDGTPLISAHAYVGVVRDAVLAFKQQGRFRLGKPLGLALGEALDLCSVEARLGPDAVVALVAVPSSPAGRRRRGYEPVGLLLAAAGARPWPRGLRLARASGTQKSRGRSARLESRVGSMRADPRLRGVGVVVVDDVVTSGGTLLEAARALRAVGAEVIGACCLAATPLVSEGVQ